MNEVVQKPKEAPKTVVKQAPKQVVNEPVVRPPVKNQNTKRITVCTGIIENKPYMLRYISSFKSQNKDRVLHMYDFSLNNKHTVYYTDMNIDEVIRTGREQDINLLFTLDNIRSARSYNTSYIGTVVNGQVVFESGIENYYYDSKVVPRENGNLVVIDNGTVILKNKRLYSYYLLSLANNKVINIVTETDIFSNINSDEELAEFLSDRNIVNSIHRHGYIGNLLPDGTITYGGE